MVYQQGQQDTFLGKNPMLTASSLSIYFHALIIRLSLRELYIELLVKE